MLSDNRVVCLASCHLAQAADAALPGGDKVFSPTVRFEHSAPDLRHTQQVISGWQLAVFSFDQHPGNRCGITQIDGQFQVRCSEEGMLAGEAAYLAGEVRIQRQVLIPELLVAQCGDSVEAMTVLVIEGRAKSGLAGGGAQ